MLRLQLACRTDCACCMRYVAFEAVIAEVEDDSGKTESTSLVEGTAWVGERLGAGLATEEGSDLAFADIQEIAEVHTRGTEGGWRIAAGFQRRDKRTVAAEHEAENHRTRFAAGVVANGEGIASRHEYLDREVEVRRSADMAGWKASPPSLPWAVEAGRRRMLVESVRVTHLRGEEGVEKTVYFAVILEGNIARMAARAAADKRPDTTVR